MNIHAILDANHSRRLVKIRVNKLIGPLDHLSDFHGADLTKKNMFTSNDESTRYWPESIRFASDIIQYISCPI